MIRVGTRWAPATISAISHRVDVNTLEHEDAASIALNEIALCDLQTATPVSFDAYAQSRETGAFILVDRATNETAGAGVIVRSLRRATNVHREDLAIDKAARAAIKYQKPCILWFTGLSGSGKSTIARLVERKLHAAGHTYMLDGDNLRHGLNQDLGFSDADRDENVRRVGEAARLFVDAGLIVLCSFISPFAAERDRVRALVGDGEFLEIFVDAPLEICVARDPKGLYAKALRGEIGGFTGISAPYEAPTQPDLRLLTGELDPEVLADRVIERVRQLSIQEEDWASP